MAIGAAVCPACGKGFNVDSSMAGKSVLCPWCGQEIYMEGVDVAPEPNAASSAAEPASASPPRREQTRTPALGLYGRYAIAAAIILICAFLGYFSAKSRIRGEAAIQRTSIPSVDLEPSSPDEGDPNIVPADEESNDGNEDASPADDEAMEDDLQAGNVVEPQAEMAGNNDETDSIAESEPVDVEDEAESEGSETGEDDDDESALAAATYEPLTLDASALSAAYREAAITSYKCRVALKEFERAIAAANAEATSNRTAMVETAAKYLEGKMTKAQAAGDFETVMAFKKALETAEGEMAGEMEEIAKLRVARDAQRARIDNALVAKCATAADKFHVNLEWQKKETTQKGDLDTAKNIAAFQKKVEEWTATIQTKATRRVASKPPEAFKPQPRSQPQSLLREVRPAEPETRIVTVDAKSPNGTSIGWANLGDTLEIQYVGGRWHHDGRSVAENPDDYGTDRRNRCLLAVRGEQNLVVAELPQGTKDEPYRYSVEEELGSEFTLRIRESWKDHSQGSVRYSVKITPGQASRAAGGRVSTRASEVGDSRPPIAGGTPAPRQDAPTTVPGRTSNQTLTGTQSEMSVTLAKTPLPHVVKEQYIVPNGKELIVEAGTTIVFEKGASLYCEGTLKMNGTEQEPIICKGHMMKIGYWNGITVKTSDSEISWLRARDAKTGLNCFDANPMIRNSVFCKNETGVNLHNCNGSFENCLLDSNEQNGLHCDYAGHNKASFKRCTFSNNGFGIDCGYYGSPQLEACIVTKNITAGITTYAYGCEVGAKDCVIIDNKGYDIQHRADLRLDFQRNYWGPSVTRLLQQRGDGANLPNIKDGRDDGRGNIVDVAEFLTEPPKDCGATVKW